MSSVFYKRSTSVLSNNVPFERVRLNILLKIKFMAAPKQQIVIAGKFGAIRQQGMMQIIADNHVDVSKFCFGTKFQ